MASTPQTLVDGALTGAATPATGDHHHHHLHHTGRRLRQIFRSDGKKVHVAASPEAANLLRKTLSATEKEDDFDLVIHGSPEHIDALRHTHQHHTYRHQRLKEDHPELADEFERVIREVDDLARELHMVSSHAVKLDANFSKYGYSAHLRTKESPTGSSAASLNSEIFDKETWDAERKLGTTMRFYQKPIVRQYFHKGLLWRAKEAQEVASYELFIDLFYVGIIAVLGDTAAEHATGESLLRFAIIFIMGWKFWSDISLLISWFDCDDILRRCSVLFILACLLGFTTNMASAFEHTYTPLVSFYLAARFFVAGSFVWYAYTIRMVRAVMLASALLIAIPAAFWVGSIHVEEPARQALIWPALILDTFGFSVVILIQRPQLWASRFPRALAWIKAHFEFFPGANIEHRIERTSAFVTLVFGSCVLGLLYQSAAEFGINAFFGKAVMGLIQAFTFNWIYFEIDSFNLHTHAIRRSVWSGTSSSLHPSFFCSVFLLSGVSRSSSKADQNQASTYTDSPSSDDMVYHPPALHNVLRALCVRPRRPCPRPRQPLLPARLPLCNRHPPLRRRNLHRSTLVLLRRVRHRAPLHGRHRTHPRPQNNTQPPPLQEQTPPHPRAVRHRHHMPACCGAG
jgi:low temperature requirement protein LtrA